MPMKSLRNRLIQAGIHILSMAFGYGFSRFIDIPHFEIAKTIDIANVLALIVTAWIAILITTVFEKQNNDHRVEKDLIITRVDNIYEIADSLQLGSNSGSIHITEASSSLKRINTALNSIYRVVAKCHFVINDDIIERLNSILADIRIMLTDTPSVTEEQLNATDLPIEIKDSIVHFNKERVSQLEVKFDTLKDLLLELQLHINNK